MIIVLNSKPVCLHLWLSISKRQNVVYALGLQVHSDFLITLYSKRALDLIVPVSKKGVGLLSKAFQILGIFLNGSTNVRNVIQMALKCLIFQKVIKSEKI